MKSWDDGYYPKNPIISDFIGTRPGYIILSDDKNCGVPSDEILHMVGGHPRDFGLVYVNFIPRKYYYKVILYRHYLDSSLYFSSIEPSIYGAKNGRMDKTELDLNNPNSDVLQTMIHLGVCKKIDPTYQVSPRYKVYTVD